MLSTALLSLASTTQSESDPLSKLLDQLEQLIPSWAWTLLCLGFVTLLFLLTVGDQLSGILSWLGVPSPFQRAQPSTEKLELTRQKLLKIVKKEVNRRLATSLHKLVKLDLYMQDQRQRIGAPKYALVPEDSDSGFQSVNRVLRTKGNKPSLDIKFTQKIIKVFERQDIQGKLLILGEPGSGKTTELLELAKDLVTRVEEDKHQPVPVILELSSWDGEAIDKWVASQLKKLYGLSEGTTQKWLDNNQILLLLDGLDELGLTKQKQCIEKINQFLETSFVSELVVCCRREEYEAGQIELDKLDGAVYLEALKKDQIRKYFEKLNRLNLWKNIHGNPTLLELAEKPLFLWMLVMSYQGNPMRNEQELFDAYIEKQLYDPSNQGTYKPGEEPTAKDTFYYLTWLAEQLEKVGETEFLIEELQPSWLPFSQQKRLYRLTVELIIGLSFWLIGGLSVGLSDGLIDGLIFGLIGGLSCWGLLVKSGRLNALIIKPKEKLKWSSSIGLFIGLTFGLSSGLIVGLISGPSFGLIGGLLFGLSIGLVGGLNGAEIIDKEMPNQGIRNSIQNSFRGILIGGLIGGLLFGLIGGLLGLSDGPIVGLLFGLIGGLLSGLDAAIQHFVLRIFFTKNGNIPWNYSRFLDHAVKHRFLQRTGGRYRFVHDLLRKHFAAIPLEPN
ncbi:MAG: NACHT domain-containing protein [Cyanobacteria bacterium P01_F01_bin.13]